MLQSLRILVLAMMWGLVIFAFALYFVLATGDGVAPPPLWLVGAQVAAGVLVHLLLEGVGYRVPPLAPGASEQTARAQSRSAYSSATFRRLALSEAIGVASLAVAFVVAEGGFFAYVTGALVSLALVGYHAWPWERPINKVVDALERDGATSYLRQELGLAPLQTGPIQKL